MRVLDLPEETLVETVRGFDGHLETQISFIIDESGHLAVDFVRRFENCENDLQRVADQTGIELEPT